MSYRYPKGISSILPMAAVLVLAAAILGYLSHLNERIARLEQEKNEFPQSQLAITNGGAVDDNGSINGKEIAADKIAGGGDSAEKIILPDDSVAISGTIIEVGEKAIVISMDPDNENFNYIANIDEKTSIKKQKDAADQNAAPANISDIKVGNIAIIESAGQISDNNEFMARKINFFDVSEG